MRRLAILPIVLLAAACTAPIGGQSSSSLAPTASPTVQPSNDPAAAGRIVARLEYVGGFTAPSYQLTRTPAVVVYGDGTVITPGVTTAQYPGPLVSPLLQQTLTPEGLALVRRAIDASGLTSAMSYPANGVADAPDTQLELHADQVDATVSQGMASDGMVTNPAEKAARKSFEALVAKLSDLTSLVGAANITGAVPFEPTGLRLYLASSHAAPTNSEVQGKVLDWPLKTPIAGFGAPYSTYGAMTCGAVTGTDFEALWSVFAQARQNGYFAQGGLFYTPSVRPLLPGEKAVCPA